jgi:hypothetical protein
MGRLPYAGCDMSSPAHAKPSASPGRVLAACAVVLAGGGVVGLAGGLAWARLAPRPVFQVFGQGVAYVVNAETTAFIAADAWFCLIGVIGGLVLGGAGYLLAVRRHGPAGMAAVLVASLGAGLGARWVGQGAGLAQFNSALAAGHTGALVHAPLVLGGDTTAILWPAVVSWPFGACVAAGALVLLYSRRPAPPVTPF